MCIIPLQLYKKPINLRNLSVFSHPEPSISARVFLVMHAGYWGIINSAISVLNVMQTCFLMDWGQERKYQKSKAYRINQKLLHVMTMINRSENIYHEKFSRVLRHCVIPELKGSFAKNELFSRPVCLLFMFKNEV